MKKKLLALVLTLMLSVSAVVVPTVSAAAPDDAQTFSVMQEQVKSAIAQQKATLSLTPVKGNVAAIQIGIPDAFLNGKKTFIDAGNKKVVPIKKSGKTMIPLRFCASSMGGTTTYTTDKDFITVKVGGKTAKFKIGSKALQIVDEKDVVLKKITLDVAAVKINGRVMVPTRAISEGLGSKVFYEKIGKDEFVLVSQNALTEEQKVYQEALLKNLKTYTFTDATKSFKVKLSGAWMGISEKELSIFANGLYQESMILNFIMPAKDASAFVNASKADLERALGEPISGFSKPTINGKKAVTFTVIVEVEDEDTGETIFEKVTYCIIASKKAGIQMVGIGEEKGFEAAYKKVYTNVTMLK